jgi:hypothetical protein
MHFVVVAVLKFDIFSQQICENKEYSFLVYVPNTVLEIKI